ncbi:MAG: aspartate aminotransferase family protein [Alphaproteobacteria bacterium]|jgi:glutamate/tyrosine decarboxylase-like PLP-dependent enzyme|nr:aspartate aminotransferase family protein [Alphaproteobacteria bacterium]
MNSGQSNRKFPDRGLSPDEIRTAMATARDGDLVWNDLKNIRASYDAGDDVTAIANEAFLTHIGDNAIYRGSAYPSLQKYEDDVIEMMLELFNAPEGASGNLTTGGTDSIIMAVKAARDWARATKPHITRPEIILPRTAHPAFNKAGDLLSVNIIRMAESPKLRADVAGMAAAVNANTIMIVGSAPPYPHGLLDPVPEISQIAEEHDLWLHIDGCLGGFILPFARDLGVSMSAFDFLVPGVRSISADLHKYGWSGRGVSALLLRDAAMREYQKFSFDDWPAGHYETDNVAGSRNGGAIASAWAVMRYLGYSGYSERVGKILKIKKALFAGIEDTQSVHVVGEPEGAHFAISGMDIDMVAVGDGLAALGWLMARATEPQSMMIQLNPLHDQIVEPFLADLKIVVDGVHDGSITRTSGDAVYIS